MADEQDRPEGRDGEENGQGSTRARRVLTDIAPHAWEHPADKAALQAMRRIPVFDDVLKRIFGFFGEKPIRLAFQADTANLRNWMIFVAAGTLYLLGEESSWGQHYFNWETGGFFAPAPAPDSVGYHGKRGQALRLDHRVHIPRDAREVYHDPPG